MKFGQATPPRFALVSAGARHTCGVREDGSVVCWGRLDIPGLLTPPEGRFSSVSAGVIHTCGVREDGTVACWGSNENHSGDYVGQATPPQGRFASVSAGVIHTCGVREDGTVACWGSNEITVAITSGKPRRRRAGSPWSARDPTIPAA